MNKTQNSIQNHYHMSDDINPHALTTTLQSTNHSHHIHTQQRRIHYLTESPRLLIRLPRETDCHFTPWLRIWSPGGGGGGGSGRLFHADGDRHWLLCEQSVEDGFDDGLDLGD